MNIEHVSKQLVQFVYLEVNRDNAIEQLAKQLASSSIVVAESEVKNELEQLAKQLVSTSIVIGESEVNELDQLTKRPTQANNLQDNQGNTEKHYHALSAKPRKPRKGGLEVLAMLSDTDQIKDLVHQFKANGAKMRNIHKVVDEFVDQLFHGFFSDDDKEANEKAASLIQFLGGNLLLFSRCKSDNALLTKLDGIIDEVFDVVESLLSSVAKSCRNRRNNNSDNGSSSGLGRSHSILSVQNNDVTSPRVSIDYQQNSSSPSSTKVVLTEVTSQCMAKFTGSSTLPPSGHAKIFKSTSVSSRNDQEVGVNSKKHQKQQLQRKVPLSSVSKWQRFKGFFARCVKSTGLH